MHPSIILQQPAPDTYIYMCPRTALPDGELKLVPLSPADNRRLMLISHPVKRQEFLGFRWLLRQCGLPPEELLYNPFGKPLFGGGLPHISATHSNSHIGLAVSDRPVGVDLEAERPQMLRIESKFVHPEELLLAGNGERTLFIRMAWGAKESLFKLEGGGGWDYREHFRISRWNPLGSAEACIQKGEHRRKCSIGFTHAGEDLLVWALETI